MLGQSSFLPAAAAAADATTTTYLGAPPAKVGAEINGSCDPGVGIAKSLPKPEKKGNRPDEVEGMTVDTGSTKEEHAEVARWRKKEKKRKRKRDVELKDDQQALVSGKRRKKGKERDLKLDNEVKEEQAEVGKRRKKEKRRQHADEVKEEQAEVGKRKERHDVVHMEEVGAGSTSGKKKRRTKVLRWRVSRKLLKFLHTREMMGHIAAETPPVIPGTGEAFFGKRLRDEIAAEFEENKEFDSYLLFQYRTKGYAEIPEVAAYNEGKSEDILYFETDVESEDEYKGVSVFQ